MNVVSIDRRIEKARKPRAPRRNRRHELDAHWRLMMSVTDLLVEPNRSICLHCRAQARSAEEIKHARDCADHLSV